MCAQKVPTVLFVDEDPSLLRLMEHILADEGYRLLTCRYPQNGFDILCREDVDCLLLDIHFDHTPESLGLLSAARALPKGRALPIVATSAMTYPEVARNALALGARKFIPKPFRPAEILEAIRAAVRGCESIPGPGHTVAVRAPQGGDPQA